MKYYIIDANVILLAGTSLTNVPLDQLECYEKCALFLDGMKKRNDFVFLDDESRIIDEYRNAYSINSYPNMAAVFFQYVIEHSIFIHLDEIEKDRFLSYPADKRLEEFDPSDRKYIALAFHDDVDAPIVEATDSKWWGIRENLKNEGIEVLFIDEKYISSKYQKKIGNKRQEL